MKYRSLTGFVFAALMFLIPLLAISESSGTAVPTRVTEARTADPQTREPAKPPSADAPDTDTKETDTPEAVVENAPEDTPKPAASSAVTGGSFKLLDTATGRVQEVSARDFVRGALAAEMPPTFHPEALKAQAVAAHTYALNLRAQRRAHPEAELKGADVTADIKNWKSYTTEKQFRERYGSAADAYWKTICEAADEVSGYVLTYEGEAIVAAYCSMSNGTTEDAANVWTGGKAYLVPVESYGDTLAPDFATTETFTAEQVYDALRAAYPGIKLGKEPADWLEVVERSESGYVTVVAAGDKTIHGKELRSLLDLRSSDFQVACDGETFTFSVSGYGHGVGLSQYGADYMARQGSSFDEILSHYYPDTTLAALRNIQ